MIFSCDSAEHRVYSFGSVVFVCVALFVSADVDKMWFLTTGPLIGIPVIFAEVSKRQDCWRIPVSRINRDRGRKLLLPHLFALLRWL